MKPDAWSFELANMRHIKTGEYTGWHPAIAVDKPNVPEGAIRNLRPLYAETALNSDLAPLNCHSEKIDGPVDLAHNPIPISLAWSVILKWIDDYSEEEASFSRYRDDVILDGIMTAAQRRSLAALFPKAARIAKPDKSSDV